MQDADGKAPIHVAIENQFPVVISLLLSHPALLLNVRDKKGHSPFAAAMIMKDNKAAQAILNREPTAAEQVWPKMKKIFFSIFFCQVCLSRRKGYDFRCGRSMGDFFFIYLFTYYTCRSLDLGDLTRD